MRALLCGLVIILMLTGCDAGACRDLSVVCPRFAARGLCSRAQRLMNARCPKACGFCTDQEVVTTTTKPPVTNDEGADPNCKDLSVNCKYMKGFCTTKVGLMRINCAKTCNLCPQADAAAQSATSEDGDYVILYDNENFGGHELKVKFDRPSLCTSMDDKTSSIRISGKATWRFYNSPNFYGRFIDLGPGDHDVSVIERLGNNEISSVKKIDNKRLYLSKFEGCSGRHLVGHDDQVHYDVTTLSACAEKCHKWTECLSFNYIQSDKVCYLSKSSKLTHPEDMVYEEGWYHFVHRQRKSSHCPKDALLDTDSGHCFKFVHTALNWQAAARYCYKLNKGHLAAFPTQAGLDVLKAILPSTGVPTEYWVGLVHTQDNYYWLRGGHKAEPTFNNWAQGEPQLTNSNRCGVAVSGAGHAWRLDDCQQAKQFLCEFVGGDGVGVDFKVRCPSGWELYNDQCFRMYREKVAYTEARESCRAQGADLLIIRSRAEQQQLSRRMKEVWNHDDTPIWIGANDRDHELQFHWVDGCSFTYASYVNIVDQSKLTIPNDAHDCLAVIPDNDMLLKWRDRACNENYYYICMGQAGKVHSNDCSRGALICPANAHCVDDMSGSRCVCDRGFVPIGQGDDLRCSATGDCWSTGDPHYHTFDGARIDFRGTCKYTLAEACVSEWSELPRWRVEVKNVKRANTNNPVVSHTGLVDLKINSHVIRFKQQRIVMVDGVQTNLPLALDGGAVKLFMSENRAMTALTDFGLKVTYDGTAKVHVTVPQVYNRKMCGLCGNFNGNPDDDLHPKGLNTPSSFTAVGNSWQVEDDSGMTSQECVPPSGDAVVQCTDDEALLYSDDNHCGAIHTRPAFIQCHSLVPPEEFFLNCRSDLCAKSGSAEVLCRSLQAYADVCEQKTGLLVHWRSGGLCSPSCPAHSQYNDAMTACPATCSEPFTPSACPFPDVPGCACQPGHVLSGDVCVPQTSCGCLDIFMNVYRQAGETWASDDCGVVYTCHAGGTIDEKPTRCHEDAHCGLDKNGRQGCHCNDGYVGDGVSICNDKNECELNDHDCPAMSECKNTVGGYTCECFSGFQKEGEFCVDMNECEAESQNDCEHKCSNEVGGYHCDCPQGVNEDGTCKPVDECALGLAQCPEHSTCKDTEDSYVCVCDRFYTSVMMTGTLQCIPYSACVAKGDPHYNTFDGKRIDYQGACKYTLAKPCPSGGHLPHQLTDFNIEVKNDRRGSEQEISFTEYVDVDIYGYRIRLGPGAEVTIGTVVENYGIRSMLNGDHYTLPVENLPGAAGLSITKAGRFLFLKTLFGLKVKFDGTKAAVILPETYKNMGMCGICGNYNDDWRDDVMDKYGNEVEATTYRVKRAGRWLTLFNYIALGDSWEVQEDTPEEGCKAINEPPNSCHDNEEEAMVMGDNWCGKIKDPNGPFSACIADFQGETSVIEEEYDECVYDVCATSNKTSSLCESLADFEDVCEERGITVNWRTPDVCPPLCIPNAVFQPDSSPCQVTCLHPDADPEYCHELPVEGCVCKEGFVLSGGDCVPIEACGCIRPSDHKYFATGEEYLSENCTKKYICLAGGEFQVEELPSCHYLAECRRVDGHLGCYCIDGYAGDGYDFCEDTNECSDENGPCYENAECSNDVGSFTCSCPEGYTGDGITCTPSEECPEGYQRSDEGSCVDIDECTDGSHTCVDKAICQNLPGSFACRCMLGYTGSGYEKCSAGKICRVTGDPHYQTYDQAFFSFMGTCKYDTSSTCSTDMGDLLPFNITTKNRACVMPGMSCLDYVEVNYDGHHVIMGQDHSLVVDGVARTPPIALSSHVTIYMIVFGRTTMVLRSDTGPLVYWDGDRYLMIIIPEEYQNKVCGLCGDMDGDRYNDLYTKDGEEGIDEGESRYSNIGNSWRVPCEDCHRHCSPTTPPDHRCTEELYMRAGQLCTQLVDHADAFGECLADAELNDLAEQLYEDCVNDICSQQGEGAMSTRCSYMQTLANACHNKLGILDHTWRSAVQCPDTCPEGMIYVKEINGCQTTCQEGVVKSNCEETALDGCVCKEGTILSGQTCIPIEDCTNTCDYNGISYRVGDKWGTENCEQLCECSAQNAVACNDTSTDGEEPCADMDFGQCRHQDGQWGCFCIDGFEPDGYGHCIDIAECDQGTHTCHGYADCIEEEPGYECRCKPGYQGDGYESCEPLPDCDEGFVRLTEDGPCTDVDECYRDNPCHDNAYCTNTEGSYTCTCNDGFTGDGFENCFDINECDTKPDACAENAECTNDAPGYSCTCAEGYSGDGSSLCEKDCDYGYTKNDDGECIDIDECEDGSADCHPSLSVCTNTPGSYECACLEGFYGDGYVCDDVDECGPMGTGPVCSPDSHCYNSLGSFSCVCQEGYTGNGQTCEEIKECDDVDLNNCDVNADCVEIQGPGFSCLCREGYAGDGTKCEELPPDCGDGFVANKDNECEDINECDEGDHECLEDDYCQNYAGGYNCVCPSGMVGDGYEDCSDENECETENYHHGACGIDAACMNEDPGYHCHCPEGYTGDPYTVCTKLQDPCPEGFERPTEDGDCENINECEGEEYPCAENAVCEDSEGSYYCHCNEGYIGDGETDCHLDPDPCSNAEDPCGTGAVCVNDVPGYHCECPIGTTGDPDEACLVIDCAPGYHFNYETELCENINECGDSELNNCTGGALCMDTEGSFRCECPEGMVIDGNNGCKVDPDPCSTAGDPCGTGAVCVNDVPDYHCECPTGTTGNPDEACLVIDCAPGYHFNYETELCENINECGESELNNCTGGAVCMDTDGSFRCECPEGMVIDGNNGCKEIKECDEEELNNCDVNANCVELPGPGFSCVCRQGYTGDGTTCDELTPDCGVGYVANENNECEDIDECDEGDHECIEDDNCQNYPGGYRCVCPQGMVGDGIAYCSDENECETGNYHHGACGTNSECINDDQGSGYHCQCPEGYTGDPNQECTKLTEPCQEGFMRMTEDADCENINECADSEQNSCTGDAVCTDTDGSYTCDCPEGTVSNGNNGCDDIDECDEGDHECIEDDYCQNFPGGYRCVCPEGMVGDGITQCSVTTTMPPSTTTEATTTEMPTTTKQDINECEDSSLYSCPEGAVCQDTDDGYTCVCLEGMEGDGMTGCTPITTVPATTVTPTQDLAQLPAAVPRFVITEGQVPIATRSYRMGPKPDADTERTILLLCDDWNNFRDGIVAVNHCLAQTLTRFTGVKVFSTVLKPASDIPAPAKADADKHHVTLISPAENASRSSTDLHIAFNDDPATLFSNLPDLVARPTHIVGHSPISGEAALKLRDSFYPSSKVILFYHVIPTELDWLHESLPYVVPSDTELVRQAESASVVYSVTEKMHWYYTAKFRNRAQKDVDHRLFLPQCDEQIFSLPRNRVHPRDPPRVLNVIPGSGSESWEGTDIATCCLNKVAIASIDGMPTRPSPILTLGAIPEGQLTNIRDSIGAFTTSDKLTLNLNSYKTKDDLLQDLSNANLCIVPPRAEPFGCLGLTALSAGIPTLISEDSAVATLVRRLTAEPEYFLVPVTPDACSVKQDSSVWRDRIMSLMQDTEEAHERAQQLRMALKRDECIKETHDNFISFCLGGIHLCHETTELVLIDEKEEERELDIKRQFNSFLLQTLKQCWRMKHHPLARKDDYLLPPGADNTLEGLLKHVTNKIEDRDRRIVGIDDTSGSFIVYCPTTEALTDLWAMCDVINNGLVENLLGRHKSQILTHFGLKDVTLRTIISGPEYLQYKREIQLVD